MQPLRGRRCRRPHLLHHLRDEADGGKPPQPFHRAASCTAGLIRPSLGPGRDAPGSDSAKPFAGFTSCRVPGRTSPSPGGSGTPAERTGAELEGGGRRRPASRRGILGLRLALGCAGRPRDVQAPARQKEERRRCLSAVLCWPHPRHSARRIWILLFGLLSALTSSARHTPGND